jgi:hypothetical protein
MKVCGFTIVRNAIKFGYPVLESIQSILPLCDKIVVAVGESEDDTLALVKSIDPEKIVILETVWDDSLRQGGKVLAAETNKAFDAIASDFDWCIYIQADEVLHEKDYPIIMDAMRAYRDDSKVEGLLFKYLHFWGTYDYIGVTRNWYRHEIRVVKNDKAVHSYKDAQGFRKSGRKLQVKKIDATVFHYGYVKSPEVVKRKISNFHSLYCGGEDLEKKKELTKSFDYTQINAVRKFEGSHPQIMRNLISRLNWHVEIDTSKPRFSIKERILFAFEKVFNYRLFEYKNYKVIN